MAHRYMAAILLALAAGIACSQADDEARTSPDDMIAVARLMVTLDRVISEEDLDGLLELVAEDAVRMPPDETAVVGKRAIAESYRALFDSFDVEITHEPLEIDVAAHLIVHRGNATGTMTPRSGGDPIQLDNKYLYVIRKRSDGSLVVWREISNRNAPAKP